MNEEENTQPDQPDDIPSALPQKFVLPTSKRGDSIWECCQVIIDYLLQNGDEEMKAQALKARAYWETEQFYFIEWGNKTRFFQLAEMAIADISHFKNLLKTLPPETQMKMDYYPDGQEDPIQVDVVAWLALKAGERVNKSLQPTGKKITGIWRGKNARKR